MIDIKLLKEYPEMFCEYASLRGSTVDISHLLDVDAEWRKINTLVDEQRSVMNTLAKQKNIEEGKKIKAELSKNENLLRELEEKRKNLLDLVGNLLAPDVPIGESDADNIEIFSWGTKPSFDFQPLYHDELGEKLGILDVKRATKMAGSGFYYWVGDGARLQSAAFLYVENLLINRGFIPFRTPVLAKKISLYATGYLPFAQDEIYRVGDSDLSLIGTSEQSLVSYKMDEIIDESELPLLYTACTPCFRYEAGAASRQTKGIFRVHQFQKQEQIIICRPEDSEYWNLFCQKNIEDIMQELGIPYRVVLVCTGDMGAPGYKKFDTEAWFPAFNAYKETHSNSNLTDYQARRSKIRYKSNNKNNFVHTISATALTERVIIALMENNQTAEGFIKIPKVLQKYMDGQEEIRPQKKTHPMQKNDFSEMESRIKKSNYTSIADKCESIREYFSNCHGTKIDTYTWLTMIVRSIWHHLEK
ncbi:MAG: serine--tRNA ligase [Holosporaceae bacterium]|jgi:seryl-tRNA synthetase|nr:serine--tRNA ligase [Holosporaceae bacterium]